MPSVFVDSNVVIYSLDRGSPRKQEQAKAWLRRLGTSNAMTLSVQVPNEVYSVLTLKYGLDPVEDGVRDELMRLRHWVTAPLDFTVVRMAWRIQDYFGVRIWDALLLASANAARCTHFLSEDLNDGQAYGRVRAVDPFRHAPADVLGPALR